MSVDDREKTAIARHNLVMEHLASTTNAAEDAAVETIVEMTKIQKKRERRRAAMAKIFGQERALKIRKGHRVLRNKLGL